MVFITQIPTIRTFKSSLLEISHQRIKTCYMNYMTCLGLLKYSISPPSSKNDLKQRTLDALILNHFKIICFLNIIKREHSKALFISCYIIAKKVSSSFRKMWLHQKIYYKIALTSIQHTIIFLVCAHPVFFLYYLMFDFLQFSQHDIIEPIYCYSNF